MGLTIKTEIEGINITITKDAIVKLLTSTIKSEEEQEEFDEEEYTEEPEAEEEEEQVQNEKKILLFDDSITDAIARTKAKAGSVFSVSDKDGVKGFLLIRCEDCGSIKGFCAKKPIDRYRCEDCGGITKLTDLRPAFQDCKCGRHSKYKTNEKAEVITNTCISCGSPVDMMLNSKRTAYTTIK